MRFVDVSPVLQTLAFDDTIVFYTSMLGFTCENRRDDWGWAALRRDEAALMIVVPPASRPISRVQFTGSLYFILQDVDFLWTAIREKVSICYPLEDMPYGMREFACYDYNGYLLQFGSALPGNEQ